MFTLLVSVICKKMKTLGLQEFTSSWCCWFKQISSSLLMNIAWLLIISYLEGSLGEQFLKAEGCAKFQGIDNLSLHCISPARYHFFPQGAMQVMLISMNQKRNHSA